MIFASENEKIMHRCLELAKIGEYYVAPNPMVGAVLVRDGKIISEGWHEQFGGPHAEVNCLKTPSSSPCLGEESIEGKESTYEGCTLYVSLEPCSHWGKTPPCAELIVRKKVKKVVIGCLDPNPKVAGRGVKILEDAGIEVEVGVLEKECRELNKRFMCLQERKRPYVILKWAQTADGYIDGLRGSEGFKGEKGSEGPLVISTPFMKQVVHKMRAENMAIMVGTNTVIKDNPKLRNTRWKGRNPIRVTMDRKGVLPLESKIFEPHGSDYPGIDEVIVYRDNTDWMYMLEDMGKRGIHSVLVEGGAQLLETILASGIWDEAQIEVADIRIGDGVKAPKINQIGQIEQYEEGHTIITYRNEPAC